MPGNFLTRHKRLVGGGLVAGGAGFGASRGLDETDRQAPEERIQTAGHHALAVAMVAPLLGVGLYAGRRMVASAGMGAAKRLGSWYGRGIGAAFTSGSVGAALAHGPMGMTVGGLAGGALAYAMNDGDLSSTAKGAGIGMLAGGLGYPIARHIVSDWKRLGRASFLGAEHPRLGSMAKTGVLGIGAVGVGLAARAYMHEPELQASDTAIPDGLGGYDAAPGLRERLAALGGTGGVVLGLHNQRH